jgi:hypothetical protein
MGEALLRESLGRLVAVVNEIQARVVVPSIVADASVVAELGYLPAVSADLRSYTRAHARFLRFIIRRSGSRRS